jgi:hypothetical protein
MSESTYNGWTNYATWRVKHDLASSLVDDETTFDDVWSLSEYLKETTTELVCGEDYYAENLVTQYAMAFLDDVNWDEIAASNADELVSKDEDEDEDAA